jgi:uncharacterized surface protein with fasciclin (FAS1) repeats
MAIKEMKPMKMWTLGLMLALGLAAGTTAMPVRAQSNDIVQTAVAAGSFKTLAKALEAADLVTTLKGAGPFTVFAPTDEAFAQIPADKLNALLADKAALTKVLTYHVVSGNVPSSQVKTGAVKTVQGQSLNVNASSQGVRVNDARVVKADVMASNGVIHVIDKVVMPK